MYLSVIVPKFICRCFSLISTLSSSPFSVSYLYSLVTSLYVPFPTSLFIIKLSFTIFIPSGISSVNIAFIFVSNLSFTTISYVYLLPTKLLSGFISTSLSPFIVLFMASFSPTSGLLGVTVAVSFKSSSPSDVKVTVFSYFSWYDVTSVEYVTIYLSLVGDLNLISNPSSLFFIRG